MRIPFFNLFITSPFEGLMEHAEVVKECSCAFQQAFECHIAISSDSFEQHRQEVIDLEHRADKIKRRVRGHLPKGTLLPVDKFQLFRYLREQDHVLDAVKDALDWISFRREAAVPEPVAKDLLLLVNAVLLPIDELSVMVSEATRYFKTFSEPQRRKVKEVIRKLRAQEHEADQVENTLKRKIFNLETDPVTVFHLVRLVEYLGAIADHAENAGDMMRAMMAR